MSKNSFKCPVPIEQRPEHEYKILKKSFSFAWTTTNKTDFLKNILILLGTTYTISTFIIYNSYKLEQDFGHIIAYIPLLANMLFLSLIFRCYLGWNYIYIRLLQATITYEESGWYDGQIWVKPKEILTQDRLLGTYELLPILNRLKTTMTIFTLVIITELYINNFILK